MREIHAMLAALVNWWFDLTGSTRWHAVEFGDDSFRMRRRVNGKWEYRDCTPKELEEAYWAWAMR